MNIKIICVGKLKEQYLRDACAEYIKRLSRFCDLTICELSEYKLPDSPSAAEIEKSIAQESMSILSKIQKTDYVIALDVKGKQMPSEKFAAVLSDKMKSGISNIAFVIGGSCGYDDTVRDRANLLLSFSQMTFPHQLFRVMALEQIYRSFKIIAGEKYHK